MEEEDLGIDIEDLQQIQGSAFEGEHYKFSDLITSCANARKYLHEKINEARLTCAAKNALGRVVDTMFDRDTILSNMKDEKIPSLMLELELLLAKACAHRIDIKRSEYPHVENLIRDKFFYIISRTYGRDRERILVATERREVRTVEQKGEKPKEQRGFSILRRS